MLHVGAMVPRAKGLRLLNAAPVLAPALQGDPKLRALARLFAALWRRGFRGEVMLAFDGHGNVDAQVRPAPLRITEESVTELIAFEATITK